MLFSKSRPARYTLVSWAVMCLRSFVVIVMPTHGAQRALMSCITTPSTAAEGARTPWLVKQQWAGI